MAHDSLTRVILDAIASSTTVKWQDSRARAALALLIGSAASLVSCKGLLERYGPSKPSKWNPDTLIHDLEAAIDDQGVHWDNADDLLVWSMGFFLNKAQQNLAAALDICTAGWVAAKLQLNPQHLRNDERGLLHGPITSRLCLLGIVAPVKPVISELRESLEGYGPEPAKKQIKALAEPYRGKSPWPSLESLHKDLPINDARCAALVFHRVNAFKHRVSGLRLDRSGIDHPIEWTVTVKAHCWVGEFWRAMLSESQRGVA